MSTDNAQWVRWSRLAAVALGIALCLVAVAFLLDDTPRLIALGVAGGLAFAAVTAAIDAYRRRRPLETNRTAIDAKARKARVLTIAAVLIGGTAGMFLNHLPTAFAGYVPVLWGILIGIFAFAALIFSPLFSPPTTARPPVSPLSRMTSVERAQRQNYE